MIRSGIGGWTFEPWRGTFFPDGLPRVQELSYASRHLPIIEVNGTFYRTQTPATFAKWASETPDDFMFALKASRGATHRNDLAQSGPSVARFLESGITELGNKLGPILWQFAKTHKFDPDGFRSFADMLPAERDGLPLCHTIEVSHPSYRDQRFLDILKERNLALAFIDDEDELDLFDPTANFIYVRLKRGRDEEPLGYTPAGHRSWLTRVSAWAQGEVPGDLPCLEAEPTACAQRDCFVFFIHGGKVRAPAAAQAFQQALAAAEDSVGPPA